MYNNYEDPREHNDFDTPDGASYNDTSHSSPAFEKKPARKKMSFVKKLGMTASLAAVAGLVGGGVFTGVTSLTASDSQPKVGVTAEADDDEAASGRLSGIPSLQDGLREAPDSSEAPSSDSGSSLDGEDIPDLPELPGSNQKGALSGSETPDASTLENDKVQHEGTVTSVALTGSDMSTADVASAVMPAMVAITNTSVQSLEDYYGGLYGGMFGFGGYGGMPEEIESTAMGTGVIIDQDDEYLYIVTNQHVIDSAKELSVAFVDEKVAEAEIVGEDAEDDLAVIKVALKALDADTLDAIRVAKMGSSDALTVGEDVIAIGNALGYGQSVSVGIVSALNRAMDGGEGVYAEGLIQTDAAINPGNSGGALLNKGGELIGINSAKYASTEIEGMGYAIPIDAAYPIIHGMIEGTYDGNAEFYEFFGNNDDPGENGGQRPGSGGTEVTSGACLGISCAGISAEYSEYYNIPQGVYVAEVMSGGAADRAKIEAGDIILSLDGTTVTTVDELTAVLNRHEPGDTVRIEIARQSRYQDRYVSGEIEITLGSRSEI